MTIHQEIERMIDSIEYLSEEAVLADIAGFSNTAQRFRDLVDSMTDDMRFLSLVEDIVVKSLQEDNP